MRRSRDENHDYVATLRREKIIFLPLAPQPKSQ